MTYKAAKNKAATNLNSLKTGNQNIAMMLQPSSNDLLAQIKTYIEQEVGGLKLAIQENHKALEQISSQLDKATDLVTGMDKRVTSVEHHLKNHTDELVRREMESAGYVIRVQNVPFTQDENILDKATEILALILKKPKEEVMLEVDQAHRSHTMYTRSQHQAPEVIIRLVRWTVRDSVFKMLRDTVCEYDGVKLTVLKEIPWRFRQRQKDYKFLTTLLHQNEIGYRWLTPGGVQFRFEEKTIKIDSVTKAQAFVKRNGSKLGATDEQTDEEQEEETQGGGIITRLQARGQLGGQGKFENRKTDRGKT